MADAPMSAEWESNGSETTLLVTEATAGAAGVVVRAVGRESGFTLIVPEDARPGDVVCWTIQGGKLTTTIRRPI